MSTEVKQDDMVPSATTALASLAKQYGGDRVFDLLPPIFRAACKTADSALYGIQKPWLEGQFAYATDGRIMVRKRLDDSTASVLAVVAPTAHRRVPKGEEFYATPREFRPISTPYKTPAKAFAICQDCQGFGRFFAPEDLWENDPDESYEPECEECDGTGITKIRDRIDIIEGFTLQTYYVALIAHYGVELFLPVDLSYEKGRKEEQSPCRITITKQEVEGFLMPMRPESAS